MDTALGHHKANTKENRIAEDLKECRENMCLLRLLKILNLSNEEAAESCLALQPSIHAFFCRLIGSSFETLCLRFSFLQNSSKFKITVGN